ncbi:MAG: PrsW family intramembrane metalloprotease [Lachnospiraceae bacterium]|nr:PrsW family intramembrane metalloprotease [Lachnospiraceae bacterium]
MIYAENILICIAVPLVISLFFIKDKARHFVMAFVVGMVVCLMSAYISGFIKTASGMSANDTSIFISPIVEELMKFIPVLFSLLLFEASSDGLLLGATGIGAGFATFENCCHILSTGAESLTYILIRGLAVGVMHLVSMIALTMGFNLLRHYKALSFSGIVGALSLSMTFHGLYNLLVSGTEISASIGFIIPLFCSLLLYIFYKRYKLFAD